MRITGGTFRSRALRAPKGQATRPTTDRVREALFGHPGLRGRLRRGRRGRTRGGPGARPLRRHRRPRPRGALARGGPGGARRVVAGRDRRSPGQRSLPGRRRTRQRSWRETSLARAMGRVARPPGRSDLVFADPPWALVGDAGPSRPPRSRNSPRPGRSPTTPGWSWSTRRAHYPLTYTDWSASTHAGTATPPLHSTNPLYSAPLR